MALKVVATLHLEVADLWLQSEQQLWAFCMSVSRKKAFLSQVDKEVVLVGVVRVRQKQKRHN